MNNPINPNSLTLTSKQLPVQTLEDLEAIIREAADDLEDNAHGALLAAIRLGTAALNAKAQIPRGAFMDWMKKAIPHKGQPWIAACMRAAQVEAELLKLPTKEQARIRAEKTSIAEFAALLKPLKDNEDDVLNPKAPPVTRAKRKADAERTIDAEVTDVEPKRKGAQLEDMPPAREANVRADLAEQRKIADARDSELKQMREDLEAWEARLKAQQADLDKREKDVEAREQALALSAPAAGYASQIQVPKAKAPRKAKAPAAEGNGPSSDDQDPVAPTPAKRPRKAKADPQTDAPADAAAPM